jgi:hypothetical protein
MTPLARETVATESRRTLRLQLEASLAMDAEQARRATDEAARHVARLNRREAEHKERMSLRSVAAALDASGIDNTFGQALRAVSSPKGSA